MILYRPIGIDLGTTNSAVAMLDPNERDLVLCTDALHRPITPSCVWFDPRNRDIVVGHRAYARKGTAPEPISSIKRSMGTQMKVNFAERDRTPAEISALILQELKKQMETELIKRTTPGVRYEVGPAIVTVPAYFGLPAIEATREAGRLAGLDVTELLHEPTAAAIYYSWKHNLGDGLYLVYDLGGGTFDVSILRRTAGEFLVLGIAGDNFLGGDDFDRRLAEHLRKLLVAEGYELDLDVAADEQDRLRFSQLVTLAERAKIELSNREEIVLRDQGTLKDKSGAPVIVETVLTRETFEKLILDLLDRTLTCCETALERARQKSAVRIEDIDHILLVGGSTYVPAVMDKVRQTFCSDSGATGHRAAAPTPIRDEPETAVALGAALRAATAGLGIADEAKRVRLWLRSAGATRRERMTISGHVEALASGIALEGGTLRLRTETSGHLGDAELKTGLRFSFADVSLRVNALNEFEFELLDSVGRPVAVFQRSITHGPDQKEAVGRALSTAVLSKPIVMEGTDGDRLIRTILLPEGHSLPARAQFNFALADASGRLRLPIYQESRIIKELSANVGSAPIGTPVQVEIECDEQVHIRVRFSLGGQDFGGRIEPPPPDAVPTEYQIQETEHRFLEAMDRLDPEDADRLNTAFQQARRDLDEARAGMDYPKVIQRAADLEGLVREARLAEPLRPPLDVIEKNHASCLELLPQAAKVKPELLKSSLRQDLDRALDKARGAYERRDRRTYEDASQALNAAMQFLGAVSRVRISEDHEVDISVRASMALSQVRQTIQFLLVNCLMAGNTSLLPNLKRQLDETDELEEQINNDPSAVLNRCQVLMTESQRIYKQISPEENRPTDLAGLLRVDSQKAPSGASLPKNLFGSH